MFVVFASLACATQTKEHEEFTVSWIIGEGFTSGVDGLNASEVEGEMGIGNYSDAEFDTQKGILYVLVANTTANDTISPDILNLRNTSTTNDSSCVEWGCDESCNYTIYWYNSSARDVASIFWSLFNNTFATEHSTCLSNLTPETFYFINLTVSDNASNDRSNNTFNFTTGPTAEEEEAAPPPPSRGGGTFLPLGPNGTINTTGLILNPDGTYSELVEDDESLFMGYGRKVMPNYPNGGMLLILIMLISLLYMIFWYKSSFLLPIYADMILLSFIFLKIELPRLTAWGSKIFSPNPTIGVLLLFILPFIVVNFIVGRMSKQMSEKINNEVDKRRRARKWRPRK